MYSLHLLPQEVEHYQMPDHLIERVPSVVFSAQVRVCSRGSLSSSQWLIGPGRSGHVQSSERGCRCEAAIALTKYQPWMSMQDHIFGQYIVDLC